MIDYFNVFVGDQTKALKGGHVKDNLDALLLVFESWDLFLFFISLSLLRQKEPVLALCWYLH